MHDLAALKSAWLTVVEFVSDRMLDPHLYFRLRYTGLVEQAESPAELAAVMAGLTEWIESGGLGAAERSALDQVLANRRLPRLAALGKLR